MAAKGDVDGGGIVVNDGFGEGSGCGLRGWAGWGLMGHGQHSENDAGGGLSGC